MRFSIREKITAIDHKLIPKMTRLGHRWERIFLGVIFVWFGALKIAGKISASSIIAKSVYWFDPSIVIPILGYWEIVIGLCLIYLPFLRVAILLLFIRFPGTCLALVYHYNECFDGAIYLPTIQGQYLLKELTLIGAALVIAGNIKIEKTPNQSTKDLTE